MSKVVVLQILNFSGVKDGLALKDSAHAGHAGRHNERALGDSNFVVFGDGILFF